MRGFVVGFSSEAQLPDLWSSAHRHWNPPIISTHGEGSFKRTMIIGGVGVAIGVALLTLGVEVRVPSHWICRDPRCNLEAQQEAIVGYP